MEIQLSHDKEGYPVVKVSPPYELVGAFLKEDIQRNPESCKAIIKAVDSIVTGEEEKWSGTGNAHTLILSKEGAKIWTLFSEPERICILSLSDLSQALDVWLAFIES